MTYALAVLALAVLTIAVLYARHMAGRHGIGPLMWRWHSGQALDGHSRTNATWLHRSSDVLHYSGHAIWWHHLPRLTRAGIRCGAELALAVTGLGILLAPRVTVPAALAVAACGAACGAWYAWRNFHGLWFHLRWVRPLRRNLELNHGIPPRSLKISRDRSRVSMTLPPGWRDTQRERDMLASIIMSKLGMYGLDKDDPEQAAWAAHHRRPHVRFALAPPPPDRVELADPRVQGMIRAAGPAEIAAGIGRRGTEVVRSVDIDSPHIGSSMKSGDGKSVRAGVDAAQLMAKGAFGIFIDPKITSHRWAKGLPNAAYASRPEQMYMMLTWLENEILHRNQQIDLHADIDGHVLVSVGCRLFVVLEEMATVQKFLARYWRERRAGDRALPARCPASEAGDVALAMGRAGLVNLEVISQRLSVAAVSGSGGNADARGNLGLIWHCDPGPSTWRMLGPDIPCPLPRRHPGRYYLADAGEACEVQGIYATNRELRALATSGIIADPPGGVPFATPQARPYRDDDGWTWKAEAIPVRELAVAGSPATPPSYMSSGQRTGPDQVFVPDPVLDAILVGEAVDAGAQDEQVTLAEAVDLGIVKVNLVAARRRSTRDPKHPRGVKVPGVKAYVYDACDLADYYARAA